MKIILMHITNFMTSFYNKATNSIRGYAFPVSRFITSLFTAASFALIILLSACEEDPTSIGGSILPGRDFNIISASDTFTVESYTAYLDSISSMHPSSSFLGSMYSDYFGITNGGFVSQLWLYSPWYNDTRTLDSMILTLEVEDVIGDMPDDGIIEVWEVDEFMHLDSTYYTSRDVPTKHLLSAFSVPKLTNFDTILKFHMSPFFIDEITRDTTMIYLRTDSIDFRNYFNGLYFNYPQTSSFHMLQLNITGGNTNLALYYTDTTGSKLAFVFPFNTKAVYYNTFKHDFDAADPEKKIKYLNQEIKDTITYVQGFNGAYTIISIPGLEQVKEQMPIGINKARLYLPAWTDENEFPKENLPERILARYVDDDGKRHYLSDYELSYEFLDGKFYTLDERYILNITNFVQDYLEGKVSEPNIEVVLPGFTRENVILKANSNDIKPRFELVLTEME